MDHYRLSDELRQQLLENAAWGKADITPRLDEAVVEEAYKSKKKKPKMEREDCDTDYEDAEEAEELEEDVHVCPLCTSQLSEAIDEEAILEHLDMVTALIDRLSQLNEGDEDIEDIIDQTITAVATQDLEEE
jgi:hypothetical protein